MKKRVLLFLMTKKGVRVLNTLIEGRMTDRIASVVIGLDKRQYDFSNEIKVLCIENDIKYCYRTDVFDINKVDYAIVVGWRWMIKDIDRLIVLHDSLLPKYRGFAPLVNALLNKEKQVGVSALWASEKYDQGDIILQKGIEMNYPVKINDAIDQVAEIYGALVEELFIMISNNIELPSYPQEHHEATYSLWRDEKDYRLNWTKTSDEIHTKVNSLGYPYRGASCRLGKRLVRVLEVEPIQDIKVENRHCGKVMFIDDGKPFVVCGTGLLRIKEAIYEDTKKSIFPLKTFRIRFK